MAKPIIVSHWSKFFDDFEISPLEFYERVKQGVGRREVPEARISSRDWKASGLLSAKRTYLRIRRGRTQFDICAAPFGKGFFFSWWQTDEVRWGWLYLLIYLLATWIIAALVSPKYASA